jgi:pimeloyl-ACP methyl ester carboxylesterase
MSRFVPSDVMWVAVSVCAASAGAPEFEQLAKLFVYDASTPVNLHIEGRESARQAEILTISYAGARAPVSASLVMPLRAGKHPAVIFMGDFRHKRDQFLAEALALAAARPPAVSLLIDAPPARPLGWRRSLNPMLEDNDRDIHIQAVIDVRRGIDLLAARPDVDASLIAYVGQSEAANWGAILRSIEPRLRAFVLIAGLPNLTDPMLSDDPEWADLKYALGHDRFARYVSSLSAVDPIRYLARSPGVPILFQFGRFDPYVSRARAEELVQAIPSPERPRFYDSGHEVNDPQALLDRGAFLATRIGVGGRRLKRR